MVASFMPPPLRHFITRRARRYATATENNSCQRYATPYATIFSAALRYLRASAMPKLLMPRLRACQICQDMPLSSRHDKRSRCHAAAHAARCHSPPCCSLFSISIITENIISSVMMASYCARYVVVDDNMSAAAFNAPVVTPTPLILNIRHALTYA